MSFNSVSSELGYLWLCSHTATQGEQKETMVTMLLRNNTDWNNQFRMEEYCRNYAIYR